MSTSSSGLRDAFHCALDMARAMPDGVGLVGFGVAHLLDGDGQTKQLVPFANRITTAGDEYYARKAAVGVAPAALAAPTAVSGMKLGTGTTAASKSGAGAALVTYIAGSNNPFDASFPAVSAVGGDTGWNVTYKTSWAAGDVTNATINEVVIVTDAGTDATSTAANTVQRAVLTTVNKTASDSLAVTWNATFLGA